LDQSHNAEGVVIPLKNGIQTCHLREGGDPLTEAYFPQQQLPATDSRRIALPKPRIKIP